MYLGFLFNQEWQDDRDNCLERIAYYLQFPPKEGTSQHVELPVEAHGLIRREKGKARPRSFVVIFLAKNGQGRVDILSKFRMEYIE